MGQSYVKKPRTVVQRDTGTKVMDHKKSRSEEEREAILDELDEVLDEIDAVLEENAEEFVQEYVQKGGQ
jgi:ubiquitin-like protein Pup